VTHHFHAVVWIDHKETRIFEFGESGIEQHRIKAVTDGGNIHHKAGTVGAGHSHESKAYLMAIADALKPNHEILIVGHGQAKTELAHFIRDHVPALAPRIMGVETVDHPSEGEVIALARKFFEKKDLTTPQLPA
jgi:stalled ribosome rescue protein Dom34